MGVWEDLRRSKRENQWRESYPFGGLSPEAERRFLAQ